MLSHADLFSVRFSEGLTEQNVNKALKVAGNQPYLTLPYFTVTFNALARLAWKYSKTYGKEKIMTKFELEVNCLQQHLEFFVSHWLC